MPSEISKPLYKYKCPIHNQWIKKGLCSNCHVEELKKKALENKTPKPLVKIGKI